MFGWETFEEFSAMCMAAKVFVLVCPFFFLLLFSLLFDSEQDFTHQFRIRTKHAFVPAGFFYHVILPFANELTFSSSSGIEATAYRLRKIVKSST